MRKKEQVNIYKLYNVFVAANLSFWIFGPLDLLMLQSYYFIWILRPFTYAYKQQSEKSDVYKLRN